MTYGLSVATLIVVIVVVVGSLLHQPFLVLGIFERGSHELFAPSWHQTLILLISAS
jgi:hypothetical protein